MKKSFDIIIVGTGPAAATAARRCRKAGRTVAIIHELPFGGTCALRGCDPKKVLRRGPEALDLLSRMDGKGIVRNEAHIDWSALATFKRSFTDPVPENQEKRFKEQGIMPFHGTARFADKTTIVVGDDLLEGKHIVIAAGAKPRPLNIPGESLVMPSDDFLELEDLPHRVMFIGGGFVGAPPNSFEVSNIGTN